MLNITIVAVGGLKENYFTAACGEYQKRLGSFCKMTVIEINEYRLGQNPSTAEIEKSLAEEGKAIIAKIPVKAYVIALCVEGSMLDSPKLAAQMEKISGEASRIMFVIGGSNGLSPQVKQRADLMLSMSNMTFPHQLARVMLFEQIYRAFSILGGLKYHK